MIAAQKDEEDKPTLPENVENFIARVYEWKTNLILTEFKN